MGEEYLRRVREWLRSAESAPLARQLREAEPEIYPELPWPRQSPENLPG
jgi:hypothetical protein